MVEEDEEVDIGPTHALMAFPELERNQYCVDVINELARAVESVLKIKGGIKKARAMKSLWADLKKNRDEILPVMFYVIKPEFREMVLVLMERFAGYEPDEEQGEL